MAWKTERLGDLGQVVTGRTPPKAKPEMFGVDFPFLTPSDMGFMERTVQTERNLSHDGASGFERIRLPAGSACFVCIGATIGKASITNETTFSNQQINSIIPDSKIADGAFIYYSVASNPDLLKKQAGGAATPIINKSAFSNIEIPLPPLPIQRRIAGILSAYDDLIEVNTRRIKALEEMARRTYEEWFVHYRFPGGNGMRPSDWKKVKLKDRIELAYGKALKAADRAGGEIPVYGSSGIVGWHNEALVDEPTLIVGRKGNVGSIHWSKTSFYAIDTVFYVKTDLPLEFVFQNLHRQRFQNSDAAVPGLNRNQAYSLPLIVPASDLLTLYVDYARPIHNFASQLHQQNINLRAQRDLLLPRLVSGAIDVSDAEQTLEAAE